MVVKNSGEIVQAFPITAGTYVGTPSAISAKGYTLVHCNEACDVTFNFGVKGTVVVSATAGMDFAIGEGCETITATGEVIIS